MLEIINMLSTLDDILVVGGVLLIGLGNFEYGVVCALLGIGIMVGKGEILVPIK